MTDMTLARRAGIGALLAAMLILAGCMFLPGKFTSTLDIRKDGTFTYGYTGDIHMLMLGEFASMGSSETHKPTFDPGPCYNASGDETTCTAEELDTRKKNHEAALIRAEERRRREGESMKAVFGGIDPSSAGAGEEIARRLRQQVGWKTVEYKGGGIFLVDFSISGTLDRDFAFPTVEQMSMAMPFVQISRRQDGTVRVHAPGFAPAQPGTPYAEMVKEADQESRAKGGAPVMIDGSFTITTDGDILENNSSAGPKANSTGKTLSWAVTAQTVWPPAAVIKLAPAQAAR